MFKSYECLWEGNDPEDVKASRTFKSTEKMTYILLVHSGNEIVRNQFLDSCLIRLEQLIKDKRFTNFYTQHQNSVNQFRDRLLKIKETDFEMGRELIRNYKLNPLASRKKTSEIRIIPNSSLEQI